jgi:hypothetical protein
MLRGITTIALLLLNLLFWGISVLLIGIVKFAVQVTAPRSPFRTRVILMLASLGDGWVATNDRIVDRMLPTRWDIAGIPEDLQPSGRYLIVSNHLSWVDVLVVPRVFHRRAAFIRFFMKQQLIWFPIAGQACWALEFPFLRRYTVEYLERHPEKRGLDVQTARRACQRYRHIPVAILSFLEGTRFTREKQSDQSSPYRNLLRPRIGAVAFVLASLGEQLDGMLDTTIEYPGGHVTFWEFACGRVPAITVRVRKLDAPPEFFTPAITEPGLARDRFRAWIESIWREKDELLDRLRATAP